MRYPMFVLVLFFALSMLVGCAVPQIQPLSLTVPPAEVLHAMNAVTLTQGQTVYLTTALNVEHVVKFTEIRDGWFFLEVDGQSHQVQNSVLSIPAEVKVFYIDSTESKTAVEIFTPDHWSVEID